MTGPVQAARPRPSERATAAVAEARRALRRLRDAEAAAGALDPTALVVAGPAARLATAAQVVALAVEGAEALAGQTARLAEAAALALALPDGWLWARHRADDAARRAADAAVAAAAVAVAVAVAALDGGQP